MSSTSLSSKPSYVNYNVSGNLVTLANLGSPLIDDFYDFYSAHLTSGVFAVANILNDSFEFFDANFGKLSGHRFLFRELQWFMVALHEYGQVWRSNQSPYCLRLDYRMGLGKENWE